MIRRRVAAVAAAVALGAAMVPSPAVPGAAAYCWLGAHWASATGHYGWASGFPSGFLGAAKNGIVGWNNISGSAWSMGYVAPGPYGPPAPGSGWFSMASSVPGGFGGVPATTLNGYSTSNGAVITWMDTYLDSSWSWNADGRMNQSTKTVDVTTIVLHEAGHWLALEHPRDCGTPITTAETAAVMNAQYVYKWKVLSDDIAGIAHIY